MGLCGCAGLPGSWGRAPLWALPVLLCLGASPWATARASFLSVQLAQLGDLWLGSTGGVASVTTLSWHRWAGKGSLWGLRVGGLVLGGLCIAQPWPPSWLLGSSLKASAPPLFSSQPSLPFRCVWCEVEPGTVKPGGLRTGPGLLSSSRCHLIVFPLRLRPAAAALPSALLRGLRRRMPGSSAGAAVPEEQSFTDRSLASTTSCQQTRAGGRAIVLI